MKTYEELVLVNYCHPDCTPLMNIMRLPKRKAFEFAGELAKSHPDTTAFYRFADFDNYYEARKKLDEYLYSQFMKLGGEPEEKHPLSFVVEGSDYLREWFGHGTKIKLPLKNISPLHITFTIGDSCAEFQKNGKVELLVVGNLKQLLKLYNGDFEAFIKDTGHHYIEAQLWSDKYIDNYRISPEN